MNDNSQVLSEFVLRRLSDPVLGFQVGPLFWLAVAAIAFLLCALYVTWKYRRDFALEDTFYPVAAAYLLIPAAGVVRTLISAVSQDGKALSWFMAMFLTQVRMAVYGVLACVFFLPSCQYWEYSEKTSRVVILLDVSRSMSDVSDDKPRPDVPPERMEKRLDNVLRFLTDENVAFLKRLMDKNPVVVYRFGGRLDEEAQTLAKGGKTWPLDEWAVWARMDLKHWLLQGLSEDGQKAMRLRADFGDGPGDGAWALQWLSQGEKAIPEAGAELGEDDHKKLKENREKLDKRIEVTRQLLQGTNVSESALAMLNREGSNMVQGVVLISDGRSTVGSDTTVKDLRDRARREGVPIFSVVVGEDRQPISILITDVQTAQQAPPDEKFNVRAEVDGVGLPDKEVPVFLDVFRPDEDPKKVKPAHTLIGKVKFLPGEPPHGQVEFAIDPTATDGPDKLPADFFKPVKKPDPKDKKDDKADDSKFSTGKPELVEGEWKFVVRVPKDENEAFVGKEHVADPVSVFVVKKPLRVLLFAGGPTHEFQFLRTLLVREVDQKRAELSVFLQNEGRDGRDVQDVAPERRLARFPTTLAIGGATVDPKLKYYNLDEYDVVIAMDPDWSEMAPEQIKLLNTWVETQAGGLVIVAGPIHTFQLARADDTSKLKELLKLFPVVPGDSVLPVNPQMNIRRNTKKPWYLNFPGANKDMEFLKLDDDKNIPLAGWDEFFFKKEKRDERDTEAKRGFFSVYPVQSVKPGATVVATFADPAAKMPDGKEHPFLVTMDYVKGHVVYLGSGEMRRLRGYKELFYERFWVKLARFASSGRRLQQDKRGALVMGRQFTTGGKVRFEAQMFGPDGNALPETIPVRAFIAPLNSDDPKDRKEIKLTPKRSSKEWGGWFKGEHPVGAAGEYKIEVAIPNSADALRGKFLVKESNPELDMVRPDYAAMYQMAGAIEEVAARLDEPTKARLRELLERRRVRVDKTDTDEAVPDRSADSPRLFFDLRSADVIPDCMLTETKQNKNRGRIEDLWDKGFVIGKDWMFFALGILAALVSAVVVVVGFVMLALVLMRSFGPGGKFTPTDLISPLGFVVLGVFGLLACGGVAWLAYKDPSIVLPYILVLLVGLLSTEWLTRKLLRLA